MNQELFDKGLKVRREVLGSEYVDNALKNADDFSRPMQELVTQMAWGEIWTRPGLDRRTRSFLNLAMITALNRPHEQAARARCAEQRPDPGRNHGGVLADRDLLRHAGRTRQLPHRARGVQRKEGLSIRRGADTTGRAAMSIETRLVRRVAWITRKMPR